MKTTHVWRQAGSISIWRYTGNVRNFPGWHVSADKAGCESLLALLAAFAADAVPALRTLAIDAPTPAVLAVPNNRSHSVIAPDRWALSFVSDAGHWAFAESSPHLEFAFGADWLPALRDAIAEAAHGHGDRSIGPLRGERLWFWWRNR